MRPRIRTLLAVLVVGGLCATGCAQSEAVIGPEAVADGPSVSTEFCLAMTRPLAFDPISLSDLGDLSEVDEQRIEAWWQRGYEGASEHAIVFMEPDATDGETSGIEQLLREGEGYEIVEFVDQVGAFAEFQELFADDEQILGAVTVTDMPPSFRVRLADLSPRGLDLFQSSFEEAPGVFEVTVIQNPVELLGPVTIEGVSLAHLLLTPILESAALVFMAPDADTGALAAVVDHFDELGARSQLIDAATLRQRTFPDLPAPDESLMTTAVSVEWFEDIDATVDELQGWSGVQSTSVRGSGIDLMVLLAAQLLATPSATDALDQARAASIRQSPNLVVVEEAVLVPLAISDRVDRPVGDAVRAASALRDELVDNCGFVAAFDSLENPLRQVVAAMGGQ